MAKQVLLGVTDRTVLVFIPDPASTDGSGKTGLNAAALTVSGTRVETDNDVVVTDYTSTLNDLSALTDAHTDWGVKEVSSTLAPGLYRLDIADAIFAAGAWYAVVYVMVTSSAAAASPIEFELIAQDLLDPTPAVDVTQIGGSNVTAASGIPEVKVASIAANAITATAIAADAITAAKVADGTIDAATFAAGAIDATAIAANAITSSELADSAAEKIADATLLRNVSNVEATAGEHTLCTVILGTLESSISGTSWTIKRTNGSTTHATKTLTTDATAEPITGIA